MWAYYLRDCLLILVKSSPFFLFTEMTSVPYACMNVWYGGYVTYICIHINRINYCCILDRYRTERVVDTATFSVYISTDIFLCRIKFFRQKILSLHIRYPCRRQWWDKPSWGFQIGTLWNRPSQHPRSTCVPVCGGVRMYVRVCVGVCVCVCVCVHMQT